MYAGPISPVESGGFMSEPLFRQGYFAAGANVSDHFEPAMAARLKRIPSRRSKEEAHVQKSPTARISGGSDDARDRQPGKCPDPRRPIRRRAASLSARSRRFDDHDRPAAPHQARARRAGEELG